MHRNLQGRYETVTTAGEAVRAFVPAPLPPDPPIAWTPELRDAFDRALVALGRLDAVSSLLPDATFFLSLYARKEAVLSSMIEGTKSTLSDLMLYEIGHDPFSTAEDAGEVLRHVAALEHGLRRLEEGFPLSLRLLREIHGVLMAGGRGSDKSPGEFRRSQNWIGGTRPGNAAFVPPPPERVMECMGKLELFLHGHPEPTPVLVRAALSHVQFETIHPFLDGNGRLGRLMIPLLLCESGVLARPMLYLSLYFKTHRARYYELLGGVRLTGDWEAWLGFFAKAVEKTAAQADETARMLVSQANGDREKIATLGRAAPSALALHRALMERPVDSAGALALKAGVTQATANKCLVHLERLGIVRELTARKRDRVFSYAPYLAILDQGTDPPRS